MTAPEQDMEDVRLDVDSANVAAVSLYAACGFRSLSACRHGHFTSTASTTTSWMMVQDFWFPARETPLLTPEQTLTLRE